MSYELANDAYELTAEIVDGEVHLRVRDLAMDFDVADGACFYRASRPCAEGTIVTKRLSDAALEVSGEVMTITGTLAALRIEHALKLPADRALMEERIVLHNPTEAVIALEDFTAGLQRRAGDDVASIFPELAPDRLVAVPFRHRPTDRADFNVDFQLADLVERPGR